jgi:hypothetical protein
VQRGSFLARTTPNQSQCNLETSKFDFVEEITPLSSNNVQILNVITPISLGGPGIELSDNLTYSKSPNIDSGGLDPFSAATGYSSFLMQRSSSIDYLKNDRTSPSPVYSASFTTSLGSYDPMTASFTTLAVQDNSAAEKWWHETQPNSSDLGSLGNDLPFYDGLPNQALMSWPSEPIPTTQWTKQVIPIDDTVSLQTLTLGSSSSSLSSSTTSSQQHSESKSRNARLTEAPSKASRDWPPTIKEPSLVSRTIGARQKLPSKPISRRHVPILPKIDQESSNKDKTRPTASRARTNASRQAALAHKSEALRRIKPKALKAEGTPDNSVVTTTESIEDAVTLRREARNEFLVGSRLMGVPYREIRRQGGFSEAESTLRGRFRTLTKEKRERVRKPEWGERDVSRRSYHPNNEM